MQDSKQQDQRSNGGCLVPIMFTVAIMLAIALGGVGGLMLEGEQLRQAITTFPDIPAPSPKTLNYVPSAQTFADRGTCADPTAPVAGWEKGVGGVLPPCWVTWTREQQNQFLRSH